MKSTTLVLASIVVACSVGHMVTQADDARRPEIGRVEWVRDYEAGRKLVSADKPMLLLFQEIPG